MQSQRNTAAQRVSIVGICMNTLLCIMKILAGIFSGSVALIADGVNNLTDASSSLVVLLGFKLAARPADDSHPFGHGRFEYIAGLIVAQCIILTGVELAHTSCNKLLHPNPVHMSFALIAVLVVSICIKALYARYAFAKAQTLNSLPIQATAADARNDCVVTSAILLAFICTQLFGIQTDGIIGCCVALFVLTSGIKLLIDTVSPLLGEAPSQECSERIYRTIMQYPQVIATHALQIHDYGPGKKFASAHVTMKDDTTVKQSHDCLSKIEEEIYKTEHIRLTLHCEPESDD